MSKNGQTKYDWTSVETFRDRQKLIGESISRLEVVNKKKIYDFFRFIIALSKSNIGHHKLDIVLSALIRTEI